MQIKMLAALALLATCRLALADAVNPAIDLMELVDVKRDTCDGHWDLAKGTLASDESRRSMIQFPYHPPAEYDFHIQCSRDKGTDAFAMMLATANGRFVWVMGGAGNDFSGFESVKGDGYKHNATTVRGAFFENGKKADIIVKVRAGGAEAYINGKLVSRLKTDYSDVTQGGWRINDAAALGVGSYKSAVTFYKIEVTEVTGKGTLVKSALGGKNPPGPSVAKVPNPPPAVKVPTDSPAGPREPIDFSITAAPRNPNAKPPTPPTDPNAIERPDFQASPKPLLKSITSATALMTIRSDNGESMGFTQDIIATVNPDSRRGDTAGIGIFRADGDDSMKTALEEAVRAVRLRYPIWEPGHIDLSFGEKSTLHGGPSAGTVFALLMLSTLEGFDLDPKCAVTGDITVDWKVRKVGGVTAKVRGATLDKCLYAAIPEGNETAFADMALLYGTSALYNIQVFSIATLQDANNIARKDRPEKLAQAIKLFAELQPQFAKSEKPTLQNPETKKTLQKILELAPNHLSAKNLLAIIDGKASKNLSANATLYRLNIIMHPFYRVVYSDEKLTRTTLPAILAVNARKQFAQLRPIAHKDFLPLLVDETAFIESMEQYAVSANSSSRDTLLNRARSLDARFDELAGDKELRGMLMREGY